MGMEMPKPGLEHEKLHRLVGTWNGDEKMHPSPWGPGGPASARSVQRAAVDGFFVIQEYEQTVDGKVMFRGHGIFGYDSRKKKVAWYWVDSMGMMPAEPSYGEWAGDKLELYSESPDMGRQRYTIELRGADSYYFAIHGSRDGKSWAPFIEGVYTRAA